MDDPYEIFDSVLLPWAKKNGVHLYNNDRGTPVRTADVFDRLGNRRAQIWLDLKNKTGEVEIITAECIPSTPQKWGRKEVMAASLDNLESALDSILKIALTWAGPGGFV
jgi:hypothetical protein